jgi:hypothetical protein
MGSLISRIGMVCGLALVSLPLGACVQDDYRSAGYGGYYDGWYDGYYGPIYDGYWGTDNYFYYRNSARDRYIRGDRNHFYRGDSAPDKRFQRFEGRTRQPSRGMQMPNYPRQDRNNTRGSRDRK